jgi:hypothetical protein
MTELLAKPDSIRITAPALPREKLERVLSIIREDVADDRVKIDTPTQNLESYFLEIVQKARQSEAATSGATSGNIVAAYLRGDAEVAPHSPDRILERLTVSPTESKPDAQPEAPKPEDLAARRKLEALTHADAAPPPPAQPKEDTKRADQDQANEKLSSLLNKPK